MNFNNNLLLIVSLSSLLLSGHAFPLIPSLEIPPSSAPTSDAPTSSGPSPGPSGMLTNIFNVPSTVSQKVISEPQVVALCTGTENPALCAKTIAPYVDGPLDPIKAVQTEVDVTLKASTKISSIIDQSLVDPNTPKSALDALDICKKQYKCIEDTVKEALELLSQQNVVDAYYKFSSVISDQSTCEDAFKETPGVEMPFADDSFTVFQLGGNCLAIMDGIVNNHNQFHF